MSNSLLDELTQALQCLPSVGPKSAQRMVYHLLDKNRQGALKLSNVLERAVHEIGHWLGLFHIWGDSGNNGNGNCSGDDGIDDTPKQSDPYQNCPSGIPISCGTNDMYINYMDYTDADCSMMFTIDQKNKMLSVLNGFRLSLLKRL